MEYEPRVGSLRTGVVHTVAATAPAGYALQAPHRPLATRTALPLVARAVHMKEAEMADPALASESEECLLWISWQRSYPG